MEILIRITLQYVGADVPTEFAKKYRHEIKETVNSHLPLCVMYGGYLAEEKSLRYITFLRYGYFSLRIAKYLLERTDAENVFRWKSVPLEFVLKRREKYYRGFNACPHLSQDTLAYIAESASYPAEASIILRNPAIFCGSIEATEKIVITIAKKGPSDLENVSSCLSGNEGASLHFFIRNPQYINWDTLIHNQGEVFRGDEKKVISFLESEKKGWGKYEWEMLDANQAIPVSFLLDNVGRFNPSSMKFNSNVPVSFFKDKLETKHPQVDLIEHPHVSFSHICSRVGDCPPSMRTYMLQSAYNIPIEGVEEMCRDNPWAVDWGCISANRGFWLRLSERDLRPILESFFYEKSS